MKKPAEAGLDPFHLCRGLAGTVASRRLRLAVQSEAVHIFSFHGHMNREVHHASRVMAAMAHGCCGTPAARRGVRGACTPCGCEPL